MSVNDKLCKAILFALLVFMFDGHLCSAIANESKSDTTEVSEYEVLNIGGLFAIHAHGQSKNQTSLCAGPFRIGGFEELNAMLFAVSKVNENRNILPGIKLQAKIEDTCSSMELATEKSLKYTIINYQSKYNCFDNHSTQDKPILAIVGERNSDISRAVTNLVGLFHIPVISYGATSSSLTEVKYFTRTIAPDTFATQALVDVIQQFRWNYVILLYSDSEYGRFSADSFREKLRKGKKNICTAVDEQINEGITEDLQTWQKIDKEKRNTKVVVVFATYEDFSGFLQTGKGKYNLEEYIWLSNDMWNGHTANLTCLLKHAISVIPNQIYIQEFAKFFQNAQKNLHDLKQHSTFSERWFEEYNSFVETKDKVDMSFNSSCVVWGSSEVSYVMDAVYTIAWALHGILKCDNIAKSCNKSEAKNFFKRELFMQAIKDVNFQNNWTQNYISFTRNGNPRNVKYSVVSFQQNLQCFVEIGQWDCLVDTVNETCRGKLALNDSTFTSGVTNNFRGICGALCPAGQYKIVDTHFASCCWQCKNCTGNGYSTKPGSSACERCKNDEWPIDNHTACAKVKPQMVLFLTKNPVGIILLCGNIVIINILIVFVILIIKYSQSKMKIFSDRMLCYILLFGILMCNVVSIFVLADAHKDNCLLMVILSKLGSTCTLGTIFIKTNDVYRTYKKKILKDDPRFLSESLKVMVVICLVIIDIALLWFSINFEGKNRKTSTTVYFPTETGNTAFVHCGFIIDFITGEIFTLLEISFYWGLLLICTHQSYLTRKVVDNAHGLRYVFFGSLALSINSLTMILAHSFTDNNGNTKELVYSFYHMFFATIALACTFFPKVEILVFHPEKDVLFDALRATTMTNPNSMVMKERVKFETPGPPDDTPES